MNRRGAPIGAIARHDRRRLPRAAARPAHRGGRQPDRVRDGGDLRRLPADRARGADRAPARELEAGRATSGSGVLGTVINVLAVALAGVRDGQHRLAAHLARAAGRAVLPGVGGADRARDDRSGRAAATSCWPARSSPVRAPPPVSVPPHGEVPPAPDGELDRARRHRDEHGLLPGRDGAEPACQLRGPQPAAAARGRRQAPHRAQPQRQDAAVGALQTWAKGVIHLDFGQTWDGLSVNEEMQPAHRGQPAAAADRHDPRRHPRRRSPARTAPYASTTPPTTRSPSPRS